MKKLRKVIIPIFLSVICGSICGKLIYQIYDKKIETDINGEKIYLIQSGAYSTYDTMVKNTSLANYIYYQDQDGLYKSIIGLTENKENIEKIKNTYKDKVIINEYYSNNKELNQKIKEYDLKMQKENNKEEIQKIVLEMLKIYKNKETTLIKEIS